MGATHPASVVIASDWWLNGRGQEEEASVQQGHFRGPATVGEEESETPPWRKKGTNRGERERSVEEGHLPGLAGIREAGGRLRRG